MRTIFMRYCLNLILIHRTAVVNSLSGQKRHIRKKIILSVNPLLGSKLLTFFI